MRAAERRVSQLRKVYEKTEAKATSAAQALREAQAAAEEAAEKVTDANKRLQSAEIEQLACCPRPAAALDEERVAALAPLSPAFADDAEASQALEFVRAKLAARIAEWPAASPLYEASPTPLNAAQGQDAEKGG